MTTPPGSVARRPAAVSNAVKLMYAVAALDVLGLVLTVADTSAIRQQVRASGSGLSATQLDQAVAVAVVFGLVFGLVGAALWVVFAIFTGRGRNWARIVTTVLAALAVLTGLTTLGGGVTLPEVVSLLAAVAAIGVVVLLYRRESGQFFASGGSSRGQVSDPGYPSHPPAQ